MPAIAFYGPAEPDADRARTISGDQSCEISMGLSAARNVNGGETEDPSLFLQGEALRPELSFTEGACHRLDRERQKAQSQNCSVPFSSMPAKPHRNHSSHYNEMSHVMEVEKRNVVKFFLEKDTIESGNHWQAESRLWSGCPSVKTSLTRSKM
jgi:hypothetical protein